VTEHTLTKATPQVNPCLRASIECAERGWPVLPLHSVRDGRCTYGRADCRSPGKHPRTAHSLKNAMTDPPMKGPGGVFLWTQTGLEQASRSWPATKNRDRPAGRWPVNDVGCPARATRRTGWQPWNTRMRQVARD